MIALNLHIAVAAAANAQVSGEPPPDTTIRHVLNAVHTGVAVLRAELTIGVEAGPAEYSFGHVVDIAVNENGDIYVVDAPRGASPVLRQYDSEGEFVREIGRAGSGPGEYVYPAGMVIMQDGRLLLYDPRNARINVYSRDGNPIDTWQVPVYRSLFLNAHRQLFTDGSGHILMRFSPVAPVSRTPEALNSAASISAFVRLTEGGGVVDTIFEPRLTHGRETVFLPYSPRPFVAWSPRGYFVTAMADRYAIDLRMNGGANVISIRRDVSLVPISRAERAEQRAWLEQQVAERGSASVPEIPQWKPILRAIHVGTDGRIWVRLSQPSRRVVSPPAGRISPAARSTEPSVYDVLEPDGTYLGAVRFPDGMIPMVMRGDHVWGVIRNQLDVPFVRRYRIAWDGGGG